MTVSTFILAGLTFGAIGGITSFFARTYLQARYKWSDDQAFVRVVLPICVTVAVVATLLMRWKVLS